MGNKFFDIKRRVDPTPPPIPTANSPKGFVFFRKIKSKKSFSVSLYSLGLIVGLGAAVLVAQANYIKFYPEECSGDWQNSSIVSENSKTPEIIDSETFDSSNSAILKNEKGREVVCGTFRGEQVDGYLVNLRLKLVWNFKYTEQITETPSAESPAVENTPEQPIEIANPPAAPADDSAQSTESSREQTEENIQDEPAVEPLTIEEEITAPETLEKTAPPQEAIPPEVPATESAPSTETPTEEPVVSPTTENASFLKLVKTANAQSEEEPSITASLVFNGHEHFLDVEYSTDNGQTWQPINDARLSIPLENVADIENLRIKVVSLSDAQNLPAVYLKGMYLEAKFVPKDSENEQIAAEEGTTEDLATEDTEGSLLDSLTETISEAVDNIAENFSTEDSLPEITQISIQPPETKWIFKVGEINKKSDLLGSIKDVFVNSNSENNTQNNYQLSIAGDQRSIKISGACSKKYYTVLLFSDENDFIRDPARSLVNRAGYCESGKFEFALSDNLIPVTTPNGKYYLIVGEQNEGEKVSTQNAPQELEITKIQ